MKGGFGMLVRIVKLWEGREQQYFEIASIPFVPFETEQKHFQKVIDRLSKGTISANRRVLSFRNMEILNGRIGCEFSADDLGWRAGEILLMSPVEMIE